MVIILGYYKRKPGLSHDQFSHHWVNVHGPLIKSIPNIERYLIRYVQHHLKSDRSQDFPDNAGFDGFSEAWFTTREAMDELFSLPFFSKEVIDDERKFLDMEATRWIVYDNQQVIIPGPKNLAEEIWRGANS